MAQPGLAVTGHYWSPDEATFDAIVTIHDKGSDYKDEDVVWQAWEAICQLYFPHAAATSGGVKYLVRREAYRGTPGPTSHTWENKPDVIVVKLSAPTLGQDGLLRSVKRDILWVECKAPCHDQPSNWHYVMKEAVGRLAVAHPDRNVWLILAIGLKWMVFYWNPNPQGQGQQNPQLYIVSDNKSTFWPVDTRICVAPITGQRHIENGTINTDRANTLDFWEKIPGTTQLKNMQSCMTFLERIMTAIQTGIYNQANPGRMT